MLPMQGFLESCVLVGMAENPTPKNYKLTKTIFLPEHRQLNAAIARFQEDFNKYFIFVPTLSVLSVCLQVNIIQGKVGYVLWLLKKTHISKKK